MIDSVSAGFGKFVPGFDFLQNLAKGASQVVPQMPNMSNWIAPNLDPEELDKRIAELKAVHFWLDQNSKALGATVQALEVQKMTLATLKGMNLNMADIANAFMPKAAAPAAPAPEKPAPAAAPAAQAAPAAAGLVDPMQLWQSLSQQFQTIASSAMAEVSKTTAIDAALDMGKNMAESMADSMRMSTSAQPEDASTAEPAQPKPAASKKTAAKKAPSAKTAVKKAGQSGG